MNELELDTVFLDRDGVINEKAGDDDYVKSWSEFRFCPGAIDAVRLLTRAGARVIVVTNQRGIARGLMSETDLADIHGRMCEEIARAGGRIDRVYHCPHDAGTCDCRKPAPGMVLQAKRDQPAIDLGRSLLVGDSLSDLECARAAGVASILVGEGVRRGRIEESARAQGLALRACGSNLYDVVRQHVLPVRAAA